MTAPQLPPEGAPQPNAAPATTPDEKATPNPGAEGPVAPPKSAEEQPPLSPEKNYTGAGAQQARTVEEQFLRYSNGGVQVYVNNTTNQSVHSGNFSTIDSQEGSASSGPTTPGVELKNDFEELNSVYVEHGCYQQAWATLHKHCSLVIFGEPGSGRETLALRLVSQLRDTVKEHLKARRIQNARSLIDCSDDDFKAVVCEQIYILTANHVSSLNQNALDRVTERVTSKQSYLIVVGHESTIALEDYTRRIHLTTDDVPAKQAVFESHIRYQIKQRANEEDLQRFDVLIKALLNEEPLQRFLEDAPDNLQRIAELAKMVASKIMEGYSIAKIIEFCKEQHKKWLPEFARQWIEQTQYSRAHLCLLIAAAIFSDVETSEFLRLADNLSDPKPLGRDFTNGDKKQWQQIYRSPSTYWMSIAHVRSVEFQEWHGDHYVRVDHVSTRPAEIVLYLLSSFWRLYVQHQDALCIWLRYLGMQENLSGRIQIAVARTVGFLHVLNSNKIENTIIIPWIKSQLVCAQHIAAMSLAFSFGFDQNANLTVLKRLEQAQQGQADGQQWIYINALIYGWLGFIKPDLFLSGIKRLVAGPPASVYLKRGEVCWEINPRLMGAEHAFNIVFNSTNLSSEDYKNIFAVLTEWATSTRNTPRQAASLVFTNLMQFENPPTKRSDENTAPASGTCPLLLKLLAADPGHVQTAALLFIRAAEGQRTLRLSYAGLKQLIFAAGRMPEAREPLKQLIRAILRHQSNGLVAPRLRQTLYNWAMTAQAAVKAGTPDDAMTTPPYSRQIVRWLYDNNDL